MTTKSDTLKRQAALLDAIGTLNGAFNLPDSEAYQLKNPLLIKSFGAPGKHEVDNDGHRKFRTLIDGYRACLYDLKIKLSGKSRAKLRLTDKLANLLRVYGITEPLAERKIVLFIRRATGDENFSSKESLAYFAGDEEK
jgi:hypothetical protein